MFNFEDVVHFADFGEQEVGFEKINGINVEVKKRRKRARPLKTKEEVESKRMIHIAVERNRRRLMNDQLQVLRSFMPGSYAQRGDQASIIGGAVEFISELEQLLQCLESQKRRRLCADSGPPTANISDNMMINLDLDPSHDHHEYNSDVADVEVKVLGFDAFIKILSRRRPGQLIKTIQALEDLHLNILHANVTTIEQNVLYSFSVKIEGEMRCTSEDIVNLVQQILSFNDTGKI